MKKIALIFTLSLAVVLTAFTVDPSKNTELPSTSEGITFFQGTYKEALTQAKKENKLIFFDAYAVWCRPCLMMKKHAFTDPAVAEYFNKNFINVMMDMEKGEGIGLSEQMDIGFYPTLLFIDGDGKIIQKKVGYMDAAALLAFGKSTQGAK